MTREQLPEGSYFTIGRRIGLGAIATLVGAMMSIYLSIAMELGDHKSRLSTLERSVVEAREETQRRRVIMQTDHDVLLRLAALQEQMAKRLERMEELLMHRSPPR